MCLNLDESTSMRITSIVQPEYRKIDLDKVKTVSDMVALFKAFYPEGVTVHVDVSKKACEAVKHLLAD